MTHLTDKRYAELRDRFRRGIEREYRSLTELGETFNRLMTDLDVAEAKLAGSAVCQGLLLDSKNHWADRARIAESEVGQQQAKRHMEAAHYLSRISALKGIVAAQETRLGAYREHSIQRGVTGSSCRMCFGQWAHSRGEGAMHEEWCPNATVALNPDGPMADALNALGGWYEWFKGKRLGGPPVEHTEKILGQELEGAGLKCPDCDEYLEDVSACGCGRSVAP